MTYLESTELKTKYKLILELHKDTFNGHYSLDKIKMNFIATSILLGGFNPMREYFKNDSLGIDFDFNKLDDLKTDFTNLIWDTKKLIKGELKQ